MSNLNTWAASLETKISNYINHLKAELNTMETEVKADIAGLRKFAKFESVMINASGEFTINITYYYKDENGNILQFQDANIGSIFITPVPPDTTINASQQSPEVIASQTIYNNLMAAIAPTIKLATPNTL